MQQAFPNITGANPKEMAALKTLQQIVDYLGNKTGAQTQAIQKANVATATNGTHGTVNTTTTAVATQHAAIDNNTLVNALLQVVSDKTGYPPDMLELSMDMEADLGIDSIKRVEIFGAMQQAFPNITGANPKEMAALKTLQQIVDYLGNKTGAQPEAILSNTTSNNNGTPEITLQHNNIKRFEPALQYLPKPDTLVIPWGKEDTILITDNGSTLVHNLIEALLKLSVNIVLIHFPKNVVAKTTNDAIKNVEHIQLDTISDEQVHNAFNSVIQKGKHITGVICTAENVIANAYKSIDKDVAFIKLSFFIAKHYGIHTVPKEVIHARKFFVTLSQIDGYLGCKNKDNHSLIQGGHNGLIKTIALEWGNMFCRSIDVLPNMDTTLAASLIMRELQDPNNKLREVGITETERHTIVAQEVLPDKNAINNIPVTQEDVFLVTGGGKGITSQCIAALAKHCKPKFVLLGRSSISEAEPTWAKGIQEEKELKKKIVEHLQATGEKPTPALVQKKYNQIISQREIQATLTLLTSYGSEAVYFQTDVCDKKQVKQVVKNAQTQLGTITGVLHGAGVLADKLITQKTDHDFEQVFSVKINGLLTLLEILPPEKLKYLLLFSSVAGFFGNPGQADYALSNEILNKLALHIAQKNKACKVIAYNWGPWDAGMVSPELKKMFEERNVYTIPLAYGASVFVNELSTVYKHNAQVLIGSGLPLPAVQLDTPLKKYTIERTLTLEENIFLKDHVISGNAVLPAVNAISMIIDSCSQLYPGLHVHTVEDCKVLKGIVFDENYVKDFVLELQETNKDATTVHFEGILLSKQKNGKQFIHYTTKVILSSTRATNEKLDITQFKKMQPVRKGADIYESNDLFHGPIFQGIQDVLQINDKELVVKCYTNPVSQQQQGQFPVTEMNPYVMDVQFQGMVVWGKFLYNAVGLPVKLTKGQFLKPLQFNTEYYVIFKLTATNEVMIRADIYTCDAEDNICMILQGGEVILYKALNEVFANKKINMA
jgi:NAD(P)-dependent dehydrogenase (short-subunit alcohol dehydrogenase family)/acyl carrier protein